MPRPPHDLENSDLITSKEVGRLLGLTPQRVGQIAAELPHFPTPVGRLFWRKEIERIAASRRRYARRAVAK
jgi:hypothetical protein